MAFVWNQTCVSLVVVRIQLIFKGFFPDNHLNSPNFCAVSPELSDGSRTTAAIMVSSSTAVHTFQGDLHLQGHSAAIVGSHYRLDDVDTLNVMQNHAHQYQPEYWGLRAYLRICRVYDTIYLLTAIGLSPRDSTHLHTNNT